MSKWLAVRQQHRRCHRIAKKLCFRDSLVLPFCKPPLTATIASDLLSCSLLRFAHDFTQIAASKSLCRTQRNDLSLVIVATSMGPPQVGSKSENFSALIVV